MGDFPTFVKAIFNNNIVGVKSNGRLPFLERCIHKIHGWRPIHHSCINGNIAILKLLIGNGCNIESEDINMWRPIHIACRYGDTEILSLLLEGNCEIDCETKNKWRPIHFACRYKHLEIIKLMIWNCCSIDCVNEYNKSPLQISQDNNHEDAVKIITEYQTIIDCIRKDNIGEFKKMYQSYIEIDDGTFNGFSFVDIAIKFNAKNIIRYLMNKRLDEKELKYYSNIINKVKIRSSSRQIRELLLYRCLRYQNGIGFQDYCSSELINGPHKLISSFLVVIARHGCRFFLDKILKNSLYDPEEWNRAVIIARDNGHHDIAEEITNRISTVDTRLKRNFSLLHTAVCDNEPDMVEYLLNCGVYDTLNDPSIIRKALVLANSLFHRRCAQAIHRFTTDQNERKLVDL